MPYSSNAGKNLIERFIRRKLRWNPKRVSTVLDVGVGSGTYSTKFRKLISGKWIGIEIWEPYVQKFGLGLKYDALLIDDAEQALVGLDGAFDFIFVGDILEHLTRNKALKVSKLAYDHLSEDGLLFFSVPIGDYPQDEFMGNPHEKHVDTWQRDDLNTLEGVKYIEQEHEIGVAVSCKAEAWGELMAPKVAVYMICKDEEKNIERAVRSTALADELVVCDTGSTDKTIEVLDDLGVVPHKIFVSPWRFDDARNIALSFVSQEVDWCVSLDGDEVLAAGFIEKLKDFAAKNRHLTRINHSFETHWNWATSDLVPNITRHYHERIHSRHGYRWIHPVHEKLVNPNEKAGWCTDILMRQLPDTKKDRSSYGPLLEQAVSEDRHDWKLWSFLYQEKLNAGDIEGAKVALAKCLEIPDSDKGFLHLRQGELYERIGDQIGARNAFNRAVEAAPYMREIYVARAEYNWRQRQWKAAYVDYVSARECKNETHGYMRREDVWDDRFEQQVNKLSKELEENVFF